MKIPPAAALLLVFCEACGSKPPVISVGSKNTTEQILLGEIIAAHLEKQLPGVRVERKLGLGNTPIVQGAMQSAAVDVSMEDSGTMLGSILKEDVPTDIAVALEQARVQYQMRFQFTVLRPLGFDHQFVVVRRASGTMADNLTAVADTRKAVTIAVVQDLADRKDAFKRLPTQYRIAFRELPRQMEPAAMYDALKSGTIDLAAGYSTDAWVDQAGYDIVKDDRALFQSHPVCLVVRNQALAAVAPLQHALETLSGKFSNPAMRHMNQEVDLKHRPPAMVAREFLASIGL